MGNESKVQHGAHELFTTGDITLSSQGSSVFIRSGGGADGIQLTSETTASMTCGPASLSMSKSSETEGAIMLNCGPQGTLMQTAGPPMVGPRITMKPDSIELAVGPPGIGPSLKIDATGIVLKFGLVEYALSPVGHKLSAAETSVSVLLAALMQKSLICKIDAETSLVVSAGTSMTSVTGQNILQAGMNMIQ